MSGIASACDVVSSKTTSKTSPLARKEKKESSPIPIKLDSPEKTAKNI